MALSIRSEQSTKEGGGLDVWLGRLGMVGFTAAIGVEIATGKGLLEVRHLLWTFYNNLIMNMYLQLQLWFWELVLVFIHRATRLTNIMSYRHIKSSKLLKLLKVTILIRLGLNLIFLEVLI